MFDIKADIWFASIVWQTKLKINNDPLVKCAKEMKLYSDGVTYTNQGGWQSKSVGNEVKEIDTFVKLVDQAVAKACGSVELPELEFYNAWFNINGKGDYNLLHNHHGSIISGVYYPFAEKDMGNIEFHRADDMQYYMPTLQKYNQFTSEKAVYKPETGLLLLFPSWLKHQVLPNKSNKERISLAFNYGVKYAN